MSGLVRSIALATAAMFATAPRSARADERITDDTPYVLASGDLRVGLWKLEYGVPKVRGLEIGTLTLPYLAWAFKVKSGNAHVKYQLVAGALTSFAASIGATYADLSGIGVAARVSIVPIQLLISRRFGDRLTFGLASMYTVIGGEGTYNADEASELGGAVAIDNLQSWFSIIARLSRGWSLYFEARAVSSVGAGASGAVHRAIDDRTAVDIQVTGNASIDELRGGSSTMVAQYSGHHFRLRLGVGYGNYNLPLLNFVVPIATPYPVFDAYWVF